jgi:hypothetical protein
MNRMNAGKTETHLMGTKKTYLRSSSRLALLALVVALVRPAAAVAEDAVRWLERALPAPLPYTTSRTTVVGASNATRSFAR